MPKMSNENWGLFIRIFRTISLNPKVKIFTFKIFIVLLILFHQTISASNEQFLDQIIQSIQNNQYKRFLNLIDEFTSTKLLPLEQLKELLGKNAHEEFRKNLIRVVNSDSETNPDREVEGRELFSEDVLKTIAICTNLELEKFIRKGRHTQNELEEIIYILEVVHRFALKESLYETVSFISYPLSEVRKAAFKALSVMNDDRIFPFIIKMATSEKDIERIYALDAFYYIHDERVVPLMIRALRDENKSVRYYAIRTLSYLKRTEAIPFFIRIVASDVNDEVRKKAIQVLSSLKPDSGFYTLLRALSDENPVIREEALKASLQYKNRKAAYYISLQLSKENEKKLQLAQTKALYLLNSTGGALGLSKRINNITDQDNLHWIIFVAGELTDRLAFRNVLAMLHHESAEIRAEAAYALGKYRYNSAVEPLLNTLLNDKEYLVQIASLLALEKIAHRSTLPKLFKLSESHPNMYLRAQIKKTLSHLIRYP